MAETTTVVDVDNADMWAHATAPEPVKEETPAPEPEAKPERSRDELGRFAKAETTEAPPIQEQPEQKPPEEAAVPSWRLREIREERDAASKRFEELQKQYAADRQTMAELQRQLQEVQKPKQEPIDFFQNPEGAIQQRLTPYEERFARLESTMKLNSSKALAVAMHGKDAVAEMETAIEQAMASNHPDMRALGAQMSVSDDPVGVAMNWFQREKLHRETGGNLASYKQKLADELLKDPAFLAKAIESAKGQAQSSSQPPPIKLPTSLSKGTAAAADDNDDSNEGLWRFATAGMRR